MQSQQVYIVWALFSAVSFSIDCDDQNGDETDDQAVYLEAGFFKPTNGKIQFLNVVSTSSPLCVVW